MHAALADILCRAFKGELVLPRGMEITAVIPFQPSRDLARVVLAAEIVYQLHGERTFGRIKLQKVLHLCEHVAALPEIEGQYRRDAAGPHDPALIQRVEAGMKEYEWFETVPRPDSNRGYAYQPLAKSGGHQSLFSQLWPSQAALIRALIKRMKVWDTDACEIFATTYAAWNDLVIWGQETTNDAILTQILAHWHKRKSRIPRPRWLEEIKEIRARNMIPTGFGQATTSPPHPELGLT